MGMGGMSLESSGRRKEVIEVLIVYDYCLNIFYHVCCYYFIVLAIKVDWLLRYWFF
jgi:hypothetical protein